VRWDAPLNALAKVPETRGVCFDALHETVDVERDEHRLGFTVVTVNDRELAVIVERGIAVARSERWVRSP
jgi:hypothetical protein